MLLLLECCQRPNQANLVRLIGNLEDSFPINQISEIINTPDLLTKHFEQINAIHQSWCESGLYAATRAFVTDYPQDSKTLAQLLQVCEIIISIPNIGAQPKATINWLKQTIDTAFEDPERHPVRLPPTTNAIHVMTIHKAKGLQFPIVFVPFVNFSTRQKGNNFFHDQNDHEKLKYICSSVCEQTEIKKCAQQAAIAELARIFYVAVTRAEYALILGIDLNNAEKKLLSNLIESNDLNQWIAVLMQQNLVYKIPYQQAVLTELKQTTPATKTISKTPTALVMQHQISKQFSFTSYSNLSQSATINKHQNDNLEKIEPTSPQHEFPIGAQHGSFLHFLLEQIEYDKAIEKQQSLILSQLIAHGYEANQLQHVNILLHNTLHTSINANHFCLSQLRPNHYIREMEFYLPMRPLFKADWEEIHRQLKQFGFGYTSDSLLLFSQSLQPTYFKGFIDLIFCIDETYFVLDYKSNFMQSNDEDDTENAIIKTIKQHHYDLQILFYLIALHRHLKANLKNYQIETHLGGGFVLFMRTMNPTIPQSGCVHFAAISKLIIWLENKMFFL